MFLLGEEFFARAFQTTFTSSSCKEDLDTLLDPSILPPDISAEVNRLQSQWIGLRLKLPVHNIRKLTACVKILFEFLRILPFLA